MHPPESVDGSSNDVNEWLVWKALAFKAAAQHIEGGGNDTQSS